jgi:hypothetical protein
MRYEPPVLYIRKKHVRAQVPYTRNRKKEDEAYVLRFPTHEIEEEAYTTRTVAQKKVNPYSHPHLL